MEAVDTLAPDERLATHSAGLPRGRCIARMMMRKANHERTSDAALPLSQGIRLLVATFPMSRDGFDEALVFAFRGLEVPPAPSAMREAPAC